jgi:hypothetical protein
MESINALKEETPKLRRDLTKVFEGSLTKLINSKDYVDTMLLNDNMYSSKVGLS